MLVSNEYGSPFLVPALFLPSSCSLSFLSLSLLSSFFLPVLFLFLTARFLLTFYSLPAPVNLRLDLVTSFHSHSDSSLLRWK